MKITSNGNVIYAQTNDYCAIGTINILETISKMSDSGRTLLEQIDDDNGVILCFGKEPLLSNLK